MKTKQQERNERKKKKLAALVSVVKLNDADRAQAQLLEKEPAPEAKLSKDANLDENGFIKVTYKKKSKKYQTTSPSIKKLKVVEYEPVIKRSRTNSVGECNDTSVGKLSEMSEYVQNKIKTQIDSDKQVLVRPTTQKTNGKTVQQDHYILLKREVPKCQTFSVSQRHLFGSSQGGSKYGTSVHNQQTLSFLKQDLTEKTLTDEEYKILRRRFRDRKRDLQNMTVLRLQENGQRASLTNAQDSRTPIFLTDIQHLLMTALIGNKAPCTPNRWLSIEKPSQLSHSVVLVVEGLSLYHYLSYERLFRKTNEIFEMKLEVVSPVKKGIIIDEIAQVPLTNVQAEELIEKYGSLESAIEMIKDPTMLVKAIFPIPEVTETASSTKDLPPGDKFPRTKLLLSALQMVEEDYPLPLRGKLSHKYREFVFTNNNYAPVTQHSPMYGMDCEMCLTSAGYKELTRISIVDEQFKTIYETLVLPPNKIINYLTPFSGITEEILKHVTKSIEEVQAEIRDLLPPDAILVGHSLKCDLAALQMMHPYVVDTSVCFNLSGCRKRKSKLQRLAQTFLQESIQENADGHDSVEDSIASLKLVKLKLANSVEFGDVILIDKRRFNESQRLIREDEIRNMFTHAAHRDKSTTIVIAGKLNHQGLKDIALKANNSVEPKSLKSVSLHELDSNKHAIKKAREIAMEHSLTITNIQITDKQLYGEDAEQTLEQLDEWIDKLWQSAVAHNGMFMVLFGGSKDCPSGLAKIAIKNNIPPIDPHSFSPLQQSLNVNAYSN